MGFDNDVMFVNQNGAAIYMYDFGHRTSLDWTDTALSKLFSLTKNSKSVKIEDFGVMGAGEDTLVTLSSKCWLCAWKVDRAQKSKSLLDKVSLNQTEGALESGCSLAVVPKTNLVVVHLTSKIQKGRQPPKSYASSFALYELLRDRFVRKGFIDFSDRGSAPVGTLAFSSKIGEDLFFAGVTRRPPYTLYTIRYNLADEKLDVVDSITKKLEGNMKILRFTLYDGELWGVNSDFMRVCIEHRLTY